MRDPLVSFDTPFQSGDGLCYPTYPKNYYNTQYTPMFGGKKIRKQKGGNHIGDYSQPSTVNDYPGDAYLANQNERYALTGSGVRQPPNPLTSSFLNNNMGITYDIQAGGKRKKMKGGDFEAQTGLLNEKMFNLDRHLDKARRQKNIEQNNQVGGKKNTKKGGTVSEEEMKSTHHSKMFSILSGGRKYNKKGGNQPPYSPQQSQNGMQQMRNPPQPPGMQQTGMNPNKIFTGAQQPTGMQQQPTGMQQQPTGMQQQPNGMQQQPNGMQQPSKIMSGGKKYNKKGGNYFFTPGSNFSSQPAEIATQMNPIAQAQHTPRGGFLMKDMSGVDAQMAASSNMMGGYKRSTRKTKGGSSDFATTLSSRGPINYPDQPTADRFRYFNKTGTYIPNTELQYAVAPISTGYSADENPYPLAYNDYIGGSMKKKKTKTATTAAEKKKKKTKAATAALAKKKKAAKIAAAKKKKASAKKK